jgi:peptidoglycan hydrolase-like protein with peptidoglycan-binding domain
LVRGDKNAEVGLLQGLLGLKKDNIFGPNTEKELKAHQEIFKLKKTGRFGPATYLRFLKDYAKTDADYITLRQGDSGQTVRALRTALVKKGYMKKAGAKFGAKTKAAVKAAKKAAGLSANGAAGPKTWRFLLK